MTKNTFIENLDGILSQIVEMQWNVYKSMTPAQRQLLRDKQIFSYIDLFDERLKNERLKNEE